MAQSTGEIWGESKSYPEIRIGSQKISYLNNFAKHYAFRKIARRFVVLFMVFADNQQTKIVGNVAILIYVGGNAQNLVSS